MNEQIDSAGQIRDGYIWTAQTCPICEGTPTKYIGKRGGASHRENLGVETEIWECEKCEFLLPNPMPLPARGLAQHYEMDADDYFRAHEKNSKNKAAERLLDQAEYLLGRKGRLLDVGVGRGETLIASKNRGWEVEGVEPSESFADYAEERVGVKIWRQPIEEANIPDDSFDVVILAAVLEHLYKPNDVINKISKILKSGGLLYLDVPNEKGLFFRVGNAYNKFRGRDWCVNLAPTFSPFHVSGFGPKSLKALLAKHGLEPRVWTVYGGISVVPSRGGFSGIFEKLASKVVTKISNIGQMGTYIEVWAVKSDRLATQPRNVKQT